mgnify:CR=1 FL=1
MRCTECESLREKIDELQDKCRAMERQRTEKEAELFETRQALKNQREIATQFEAGAALLILRAEKAEADYADLVARYAKVTALISRLAAKSVDDLNAQCEWLKQNGGDHV